MKKIISVTIIILFLIPFLSHSVRYFKENNSQKKIVPGKKQPAGGASKVPLAPTLFKKSREAGAPKERMKAAGKSSNEKTPDAMKKPIEEVKPKEQKHGPDIHDAILGYRLNSKDHIKQIQACLKKAGFYKGEIDGKMGTRTRLAIKEFQKAKKLNPDGVVGSKTWEALSQYLKD
ncbi:MAG: peptidoglycan-binding domain-containing protein [Candidatus Omnitrophota bacterium]